MTADLNVFPRLVPADRQVRVLLEARPGSDLFVDGMDIVVLARGREGGEDCLPREFVMQNGQVELTCAFPGEQAHSISIVHTDVGGKRSRVASCEVYSLHADLFALRPYKGDVHMHSNRSDGTEEPARVPGLCRRAGLDFMALTDHERYQPSLDAIAAFDGVPVDLKMFPGEEVHAPGSDVHIINFGGLFSVNRLFEDRDRYEAEVNEIRSGLEAGLGEKDQYRYAASLWCYRKIREAGGLSVFCHPYWITGMRDNVSESLVDRHFADMEFDAFEILGGFPPDQMESNIRQVARYWDERVKGRDIPIVGASDDHGEMCDLRGRYYTIVFAESCEFDSVVAAIRQLRAVAVEAHGDMMARAHGSYRLVSYAQFLVREYFPLHDELCAREGELMIALADGDHHAAEKLSDLKGRVSSLMDRCWAR